MRVTRSLGSSNKVLLLILIISVLAISLLMGTGEAKISFANNNAASEVVDIRALYSVRHQNVIQGSSQVFNLPGRIEVEDYKDGGEGIGYHDKTSGNSGDEYCSDDVDISSTSDAGGGYKVVATASGEWLAFNIIGEATREYNITAHVASGEELALNLST
jgi:DUF5010 C-terminal domain